MKKYLLSVLCVLFLFCTMFYIVLQRISLNVDAVNAANQAAQQETQQPQTTPEPETTPEPVAQPEPEPEYFTLSAIGDCTLGPRPNSADFVNKVNGDFSYPFANTVQYFESDEFTIANLECTFSDRDLPYDYTVAMFYFIAGSDYANILTQGGVDFVTVWTTPAPRLRPWACPTALRIRPRSWRAKTASNLASTPPTTILSPTRTGPSRPWPS